MIILLVIGYIGMGLLTSTFVITHGKRKRWADDTYYPLGIVGGLFWPAVFPIFPLAYATYYAAIAVDRASDKLAGRK